MCNRYIKKIEKIFPIVQLIIFRFSRMNNRTVNNEGGNLGTNSSDKVQSGLFMRSTSDGVQTQSFGNDGGSSVVRSRSAPQPAVLAPRMAVDTDLDRREPPLLMMDPPVRQVAYGRNEFPIQFHREDDRDLGSSDEDEDLFPHVHNIYSTLRFVNCDGELGLKLAEDEPEPPLKKGRLNGFPEVPEVPEVPIQYHREDEHDLGSSDEDEDIEWEDGDAPYFDQQRYREEDVGHNIGSTDDDPYFDEVDEDDEDDEFLWGESEHEYQVNRREYDETGAFLELANNWDGQQRTEWHNDDPDFEGIEYDYPDSDDLMEDDLSLIHI